MLGGGLNTLGQYAPTLSGLTGDAGNALGIVGGLEAGGARGDLGAAANAAKLAGNTTGTSSLTGIGNDLGSALGLYGGLQTGGVGGYGQALGSGLNLAGQLGSQTGALSGATSGALSSAGGEIAAPLAVYNAVNNWQSGKTGSDALNGAEAGAAVGSIVPVIGTGIGALAGGAIGALSSALGPGATDPEQGTWGQFLNAYDTGGSKATQAYLAAHPELQGANISAFKNAHLGGGNGPSPYAAPGVAAQQQGEQTAATQGAQNAVSGGSGAGDFQALAGLFDMRSSDLPFYQQYGRMGEGKFTTDMANQIDSAIKGGKISANATPQQIYSQVVNPWISGMNNSASSTGKGWAAQGTGASGGDIEGQMQAPVQQLLTNLISNYQQGQPFYTVGGSQVQLPAYAAKGGSMDRKRRDMREIYKGSFKERRFDSGGSAYNNYAGYISNNVSPGSLDYFSPALGGNTTDPYQLANGANLPTNPNLGVPGTGLGATGEGTAGLTPQQLQELEGGATGAANSVGPGVNSGALSGLLGSGGLGNAWSGLSTGQQVGTLGALLAGLGAIQNNGQNMTQQYKPAPPPMFANTGPRGTAQGAPAGANMYGNFSTQPRSRVNPGITNYATYGQGPAAMFYSPSPSQAPAAAGALNQASAIPAAAPAAPQGQSLQAVLAQLAQQPGVARGVGTQNPNAYAMARGGDVGHYFVGGYVGQPRPPMMGQQPMAQPGRMQQPQMPSRPIQQPSPMGPQMPLRQGLPPPVAANPGEMPGGQSMASRLGGPGVPGGAPPMPQQPLRPFDGNPVRPMLAHGGELGRDHPRGHRAQGLLDGPGDGTSDDIVPAALSQGEYVIPAHVVAALGNGSNKAGAARLDELQKNVRMKTGQAMARNQHPTGKNRAKSPAAYMRGGK